MLEIKRQLAIKIAEITWLTVDEVMDMLEKPKNPDFGDYSFPCFKLSKIMEKSQNHDT